MSSFSDEPLDREPEHEVPSEAQLVLLCLDYLRDLRRAYPNKDDLLEAEGLDANHISLAIYSLSRAFKKPSPLTNESPEGNDAWMDRTVAGKLDPATLEKSSPTFGSKSTTLPPLNTINKEILYSKNPNQDPDTSFVATFDPNDENADPSTWHYYEDSNPSNLHRFYPLNGLASWAPLQLGELTVAGLEGLGARSRLQAEREMVQTPLFEQYVSAVRSKGFFRAPDDDDMLHDDDEAKQQQRAAEIYEERFLKVVAKFRSKLETKALQQQQEQQTAAGDSPLSGRHALTMSARDQQLQRRQERAEAARRVREHGGGDDNDAAALKEQQSSTTGERHQHSEEPHYSVLSSLTQPPSPEKYPKSPLNSREVELEDPIVASSLHNPLDLEEAERLKMAGNVHMQKKEYQAAADSYTAALKLSPAGPHSHVYFSNRAAALLSMKKFHQAIEDSERSLALKPDYGKAHARLGLAHFLLGNYRQALEAYTVSLKYEPDNKSSKTYLEKAAKRLAKQEAGGGDDEATSFSVVSEWDKKDTSSPSLMDAVERKRVGLVDQKEAERFKSKGNSCMASRDYQAALDAYTTAVQLCPKGEHSHVYYSNRAAALCYLERYEEAEGDAERALMLAPKYGKAHARLGLSRFFMRDYQGAIDAYKEALRFDPDNAASKSYLAKAEMRLQNEQAAAAATGGGGGKDDSMDVMVKDRFAGGGGSKHDPPSGLSEI